MSNSKSINQRYNPSEIEAKWQKVWDDAKIYSPNLDKDARPYYNLMMFPYPSAEGMHVGNMYAFTGADVHGRFQRMQGKSVFEPIGLDGFGIHSENYAIKVGKHPAEQAKISEKNFYKQLKSIGNSFDWSRTAETYKPEYYKWTQWLFIQLFKAGLAYRKKAPVNFCPSCKTVLADEQVEDGRCERCESLAEKRDLEQWFFKITKYADRLLDGLMQIDWSERVKIAQKMWIGKSEGMKIDFELAKTYKYIFIHGHNGGKKNDFWIWLKEELEKRGSAVEMYDLPTNGNPNIETQVKFLLEKHKFDKNTIVIAHSLGCVDAFKLLPKLENKLKKLILVAPALSSNLADGKKRPELEAATDWKFDFEKIKNKTNEIVVIRDSNDDVIFPAWPQEISNKLNAKLVTIKANMPHFNSSREPIILNEAVEQIDVFTTRPETIDGATFLVLSPQHPKAKGFKSKEVVDYIAKSIKKTDEERRKEKTGVFSGEYAINPLTKKKIPIWIADYVLMGYGTGAIMAVPAEDERDREFAKKYNIPIEKTSLNAKPEGKKTINYHLRDWLISRQRYWGPPIPMINCPKCGWQPVPEDQLPVKLPFIEDYKPLGTGIAPLASHPEFYKTKCPKCGGDAKRETDVSDTFLDSAWYFLKYVSTDIDNTAFDRERVKKWLPVNMYIGGAEHSVLHLLYARFITMVLKDLGLINFEEPFKKFRAHGLIIKDGAKMSKSKGNVVIPDAYIKKFGADTLRAYLMFMGPFSQGGDFRDTGIEGMYRFVKRIYALFTKSQISPVPKGGNLKSQISDEGLQMMHKTIKKVTEDIEGLNYNTVIAALMEWYNFLSKLQNVSKEEIEVFVKLLAPFTPHISEELYQLLSKKNEFSSIHVSSWPKFDPKFLVKNELTIAVQVNGKLRGNILVDSVTSKDKTKIEELAKNDNNVSKHLESKEIKKVIYVEGRIVNFVAA
jgi:leucyl-tRNA synthetase